MKAIMAEERRLKEANEKLLNNICDEVVKAAGGDATPLDTVKQVISEHKVSMARRLFDITRQHPVQVLSWFTDVTDLCSAVQMVSKLCLNQGHKCSLVKSHMGHEYRSCADDHFVLTIAC